MSVTVIPFPAIDVAECSNPDHRPMGRVFQFPNVADIQAAVKLCIILINQIDGEVETDAENALAKHFDDGEF